ncbi:DEAD-box ATP-dependent RNA helicase 16 [Capsicum baccatum]|uniref:DEAD-box ATP-dependent RNA helicase 16 n=1 Tax=Capsicum baccatum TaxID=33114 RepID=A0A2G2VN87_CAPBA|nr:DEAD-box ATP-dependent RNA helicase 16 [Capsicum baccatum]
MPSGIFPDNSVLRRLRTCKEEEKFDVGSDEEMYVEAPINYNNSSEVSSDIGSGYFIDCGHADDWKLLKAHFQDNPKDLDLLKHDKMLSKKAPSPYLRDVPNYLLDPTTQEASKIVKLARAAMGNTNPSRGKGSKRRIFRKFDDDHNSYLTLLELEKLMRNVNFREENAEKIYVCIDNETINYLNRQYVRRALHARLVGVRSWDVCNTPPNPRTVANNDGTNKNFPGLNLYGWIAGEDFYTAEDA